MKYAFFTLLGATIATAVMGFFLGKALNELEATEGMLTDVMADPRVKAVLS